MDLLSGFAKTLARIRKAQGFSSAYAFYHGCGGKKAFGVTFQNYARAERGASLPKGPVFGKILQSMQLRARSPELRELLFAYMACVLGTDNYSGSFLTEGDIDVSPGSWVMAEALARQSIEARKVQPSMFQYRLLAKSPDAYALHVMLYNTAGGLTADYLARKAGLSPARLRSVLEELRKVRLVRLAGNKVRSVWENMFVTPPEPVGEMKEIFDALSGHRARWLAEGRARLVEAPYLNFRAPRERMGKYCRHLADTVRMAALFGNNEDSPGSAFFLAEGRVFELFPG